MKTCEACGRDFRQIRKDPTCPFCGYNTNPHSSLPRSKSSIVRMEQERREREEMEQELHEYLDICTD